MGCGTRHEDMHICGVRVCDVMFACVFVVVLEGVEVNSV